MKARLAVVEDDVAQAELLAESLRGEGYDVVTYHDGAEALLALESAAVVDVVLTDVSMPRMDGLQLCTALKESRPELPVIVITAESRVETAVSALRVGAYDFISKPIELELMMPCVRRAVERRQLTRALVHQGKLPAGEQAKLFGESVAMQQVRDLVSRVAASGASVLVHGETGTGKELVARALHDLSPRAKGPFVPINCAALPASLVESELFGYAKGAFTDARAAKQGLFVEATDGTLFLDEVAELSLDNQAKLLRALQERKVRPIGSNAEVAFDARVLCATHQDLEVEAEAGRFRQDLLYRLNVIRIDLPPLRDRGMDVVHLASLFLERVCKRDGREPLTLPADVAHKMLNYAWPGNVRELENCIERLAALARGGQLSVGDLPDKLRSYQRERFSVSVDEAEEIVPLDEFEKRYVLRVLQLVHDNRSRAADMLGIDRRTLYRKLETWGLPTWRTAPTDEAPAAANDRPAGGS
ncbi:MAG: sigma-54-dependent Fis family transcriptional regulator [Archangium sp.]|nr:sigma-54-dependent Fis family transcriptional regulator [Archangium sp.]